MPKAPKKHFEYDPAAPIQKSKGEGWRANAALKDYYLLGSTRSLRKLHAIYLKQSSSENQTKKDNPPTISMTSMSTWSKRYRWQERVLDQSRIDTNEDLALWSARRQEIRENDYQQGQQIRSLAMKILEECPEYIITKEVREGDTVTIIKEIDGRLMLQAFKIASEMQRLAADMNTANIDTRLDDKSIDVIAGTVRSTLMARIEGEMEAPKPGETPRNNPESDK